MRRTDFRTDDKGARGRTGDATRGPCSTSPSFETSLHEGDANQRNRRASDEGWEDLLEDAGFCERGADFEERAECSSTDQGSIALWAGSFAAVRVRGAIAGFCIL